MSDFNFLNPIQFDSKEEIEEYNRPLNVKKDDIILFTLRSLRPGRIVRSKVIVVDVIHYDNPYHNEVIMKYTNDTIHRVFTENSEGIFKLPNRYIINGYSEIINK